MDGFPGVYFIYDISPIMVIARLHLRLYDDRVSHSDHCCCNVVLLLTVEGLGFRVWSPEFPEVGVSETELPDGHAGCHSVVGVSETELPDRHAGCHSVYHLHLLVDGLTRFEPRSNHVVSLTTFCTAHHSVTGAFTRWMARTYQTFRCTACSRRESQTPFNTLSTHFRCYFSDFGSFIDLLPAR